jgi:sterol carrier protein 2
MGTRTFILGIGMVPFKKPGQNDPYPVMASAAARAALADAQIEYRDVQQAYVGYCLGDSACGQRALYEIGMTTIPIFNVNNNCATGSTALLLARQSIEAGAADCVLVVGFEEMPKRAAGSPFADWVSPIERHVEAIRRTQGLSDAPIAAQFFGGAGREHRERFGTKLETFAKITEKARRHATANEHAIFREPLGIADVLASPLVFDPLTRFQCCPMTCGAAAVLVCS